MDRDGVFGTGIPRDVLLNKISLLAMLGSVREGHQEHSLTTSADDHPKRSLTVDQEAELVRNLSFLAYRRKDSHIVVAVCIEEHEDGEGMTIRFAVNGEKGSYVKEGLEEICTTLQIISQRGGLEAHDIEMLFHVVVRVDFTRISARLRLSKRKQSSGKSSPFVQIHNLLQEYSTTKTSDARIVEFQHQLKRMITLYSRLKSNFMQRDDPSVWNDMEQIIKEAYQLSQCSEFFTTLQGLFKAEKQQLELLRDLVHKVGHYYGACVELVRAARRKRYRIFRQIQVDSFQLQVPKSIRASSSKATLKSALQLINTLTTSPDTSQVLQRVHNSQVEAATALANRVERSRPLSKVHAEIKLLFYYEMHPKSVLPRVICANKTACYLCDLFLKVHGQFQVPATFGKLRERWILPDWLDNDMLPADRRLTLQRTVQQFDSALDVQIRQLLTGVKRMPDPKESTIGLPAYWSASSLEDSPYNSQHLDRVVTQSTTGHTTTNADETSYASHTYPGYLNRLRDGEQVRSSIALSQPRGPQQLEHFSKSGPKSRSYETMLPVLPTYYNNNTTQLGSSVQKLNFHDLELFLESGHPYTDRLTVTRCSEPTDLLPILLSSKSCINIDKMKSGEELILGFRPVSRSGEKHLYFHGRGRSGLISWWKLSCW